MKQNNCDCGDDFLCKAVHCPRKGKAYSNHIDDIEWIERNHPSFIARLKREAK